MPGLRAGCSRSGSRCRAHSRTGGSHCRGPVTPHYAVLHPGLLGPPRYQDGQVVVRIAPAVPAGQPAALLLNRVGTGLGGSFRIDSPPGLVRA